MNGLPLMFLLVFGLGWALASWWAAVKPGGLLDLRAENERLWAGCPSAVGEIEYPQSNVRHR